MHSSGVVGCTTVLACALALMHPASPRPCLSPYTRHSEQIVVQNGGLFEDVPRTSTGTAILGDPRNDEHAILSGLHAAFLLFHNNAVDYVFAHNRRLRLEDIYREVRRLTTWHYHWMIVHEFLPKVIGRSAVNDILARGRRFYTPSVGFMPVEFQGACYRMGHSMVRPSYRLNLALRQLPSEVA